MDPKRTHKNIPTVLLAAAFAFAAAAQASPPESALSTGVRALRIPFVENRGQTDPRVGFYATTFGGTPFVTRKGVLVHAIPGVSGDPARGLVIRESFQPDAPLNPKGKGPSLSRVNFIKGRHGRPELTDLHTYNEVDLGEIRGTLILTWIFAKKAIAARGLPRPAPFRRVGGEGST